MRWSPPRSFRDSEWWWRPFRPRRTIWPTRDGWWCLLVVIGLGVAAINTGNNLLYLLVSLLLSLIVVSGVLSEQSMRGLRLEADIPDEIYAGAPALFGAVLRNDKRWLTSYSVTLELLARGGPSRFIYQPGLEPGAERLMTWEETLPARGPTRLSGVRLTTRFPFGLFIKAGRVMLEADVLVFPAVRPISAEALQRLVGPGTASTRRRGRGHELYNLRAYRPGDDPRHIHWRSSAKTEALMVREMEAETTEDTRVLLVGTGGRDPLRLEAALSEAASAVVHLLRAGSGVELEGPGLFVPLGRGVGQVLRILTVLTLYEPGRAQAEGPDGHPLGARLAFGRGSEDESRRALRELRVELD
jgi:uncharacterized protein (DUF58 family)